MEPLKKEKTMKPMLSVASSLVTGLITGISWLFSIRGLAILYLWVATVITFLLLWSLEYTAAARGVGSTRVVDEDIPLEFYPEKIPRSVSEIVPGHLAALPSWSMEKVLEVTVGAMMIFAAQMPGWLLLRWRCASPTHRRFWPRFFIWGLAVSCLWISTALIAANYGFDLYLLSLNPDSIWVPGDITDILGAVGWPALLVGLLLIAQSPFWFGLWLLDRWPVVTGVSHVQTPIETPTENLAEQPIEKPPEKPLRRNAKRYLWATTAIAVIFFFYQIVDLWPLSPPEETLGGVLYLVIGILILGLGMILLAVQLPAWLILWWPPLVRFRLDDLSPLSRSLYQAASMYFWLALVLFCAAWIGVGFYGSLFFSDRIRILFIPFWLLSLPFFFAFLVYFLLPTWGTLWWIWHREHPQATPTRSQNRGLGWVVGFLWVPLITAMVVSVRLIYLTHFTGHEIYIPADMEGFLRQLWTGVVVAQGLGWLALWWHYRHSRPALDTTS